MSFIQEPSIALYTSTYTVDSSVLPNKYLPSFQRPTHLMSYRSENTVTDKNRNDINSTIPLTQPWYQPGSIENQALLDHYGITNNQQYRKHMTNHSVDICTFNNISFTKTIQ